MKKINASIFSYEFGELSCQGIRLSELAQKFSTPLYVYNMQYIYEELEKFQEGLKGLNFLICYAVKANSNLSILSGLLGKGVGLDLVSGGELVRARRLKAPGDRLIFSGVGKTLTEMRMALNYGEQGIRSLHIESLEEARALNQVAIDLGKTAKICLRYNPNVDPQTHPYISTGLHRNKFGLNREEVLTMAQEIKSLKGLEWKGLSIHIGSLIKELSPFEDSFVDLLNLAKELKEKYHIHLTDLDLGGGLGVPYRENESFATINDYTTLVQKIFAKEKFQLLLEPGRTLVANSGVLLTEVLYRKPREEKDFLVVDASMSELIRPCLYQAYHEIFPLKEAQKQGARKSTDIVGPVCESSDFLAQDRQFPQNIKSGDLLAVMSAGAYGMSMSSRFNTRPLVAEVLIDRGEAKLIARREMWDEMLAREDNPNEN